MAESKQRISDSELQGENVFSVFPMECFRSWFSFLLLGRLFHYQILCLFNKKAKICINHNRTHTQARLKRRLAPTRREIGIGIGIYLLLSGHVCGQRGLYVYINRSQSNAIALGQPLRLKHDHQLISPAARILAGSVANSPRSASAGCQHVTGLLLLSGQLLVGSHLAGSFSRVSWAQQVRACT